MKKVSITLQGHRTSFSLEPEFLLLLRALADDQGLNLAQLVAEVDRARLAETEPPNLSSALRLFVLRALIEQHMSVEPLSSTIRSSALSRAAHRLSQRR